MHRQLRSGFALRDFEAFERELRHRSRRGLPSRCGGVAPSLDDGAIPVDPDGIQLQLGFADPENDRDIDACPLSEIRPRTARRARLRGSGGMKPDDQFRG